MGVCCIILLLASICGGGFGDYEREGEVVVHYSVSLGEINGRGC